VRRDRWWTWALVVVIAALSPGALAGCSAPLFRLREPYGVRRADPVGAQPVDRRMAWIRDGDAGAVGTVAGLDLRGYGVLVLEPFTLNAADLVDDEDRRLAAEVLGIIHQRLMAGLRDAGTFECVLDTETEVAPAEAGRVLLLRGRISRFASGDRLKRLVLGLGSGQTQLQMETRFVDAASGRVMLATADRWIASEGILGGESRGFVLESAGELARGLAALVRRAPRPD
jgi:hypothetical protein